MTLDWNVLSKDTRLSEDFIREHAEKINWKTISHAHSLSYEFIAEFYPLFDLLSLKQNEHISLSRTEWDSLEKACVRHWKQFVFFEKCKEKNRFCIIFDSKKFFTNVHHKQIKIEYKIRSYPVPHIGFHFSVQRPKGYWNMYLPNEAMFSNKVEEIIFLYVLTKHLHSKKIHELDLPVQNEAS